MKPMNDRTQSESTAGQPAPRKRFRIEKLEERIAPAKGGGTKNCSSNKPISTDSWGGSR